jgi:hypothetical protein
VRCRWRRSPGRSRATSHHRVSDPSRDRRGRVSCASRSRRRLHWKLFR